MTGFFTVWLYCVLALVVLFVAALVAAGLNMWRKGETPKDRASGRWIIQGLFLYGGGMVALQNLAALVWPQPYDDLPALTHVSLIALGAAAMVAGFLIFRHVKQT